MITHFLSPTPTFSSCPLLLFTSPSPSSEVSPFHLPLSSPLPPSVIIILSSPFVASLLHCSRPSFRLFSFPPLLPSSSLTYPFRAHHKILFYLPLAQPPFLIPRSSSSPSLIPPLSHLLSSYTLPLSSRSCSLPRCTNYKGTSILRYRQSLALFSRPKDCVSREVIKWNTQIVTDPPKCENYFF